MFCIIIVYFPQDCTLFLMMYQTSLSEDDPPRLFAGIISGVYLIFCNYFFKIFDLYTVRYQTTAQTKCYTVPMECQRSKTLVNLHLS